ncbi:phosphoribosyltransferase [Crenobacter intestini]|uniref:Phosphoribosyltransferase n=1 Tax=Crenobacter intestini TaxID=2563443 RepID=A0A4T0V636_9NEIS|nr:phosphoribosyltransferase family protein [Crenobacter intestini]TIC86907.1 phosphoribosyltransferase [Crenobacter intestini]
MIFEDRVDAALRLAPRLAALGLANPLWLAIPRGALPLAVALAARLGGEVDVVLVRKLGAPGNPEFAVGALAEDGQCIVLPWARQAGADEAWIAAERAREAVKIRARRALLTPQRQACPATGRDVVVIDDGMATGATMQLALMCVRAEQPARLVCAVPVASPDALARVRALADDVVCLSAPADFSAVGQHYRDFAQVSDEDAASLLRRARGEHP